MISELTDILSVRANDALIFSGLQEQMRELRREYGTRALDREDYQLLWREAEQLKNKYGGMPPINQ